MSATDLTMAPGTAEQPRSPGARAVGGPWLRVALACAVLAAAGGVRWWQARRVEALLASGRVPPFPLKGLPMSVGSWRVSEGREEALEPDVVQFLNCDDYVRRLYVDERTGVVVDALVLYGPATIAHYPELCFPGAGFQQVAGPDTRTLEVDGRPASFTSLVFAKGEGGTADRRQVLYALRYGDRWTTDTDNRKFLRLPGLYKIQLTRRVGERERLDVANPCEAFLEAMLPEIERRIASARRSAAG